MASSIAPRNLRKQQRERIQSSPNLTPCWVVSSPKSDDSLKRRLSFKRRFGYGPISCKHGWTLPLF